jgi:hypothetical protein
LTEAQTGFTRGQTARARAAGAGSGDHRNTVLALADRERQAWRRRAAWERHTRLAPLTRDELEALLAPLFDLACFLYEENNLDPKGFGEAMIALGAVSGAIALRATGLRGNPIATRRIAAGRRRVTKTDAVQKRLP